MLRQPHAATSFVRSLVVRVLGGLFLCLAVVAGASPASAEVGRDDGMAWSLDGARFDDVLTAPLLSPDLVFSPGSVERMRVWVRNDSAVTRDLVLGLRVGDGVRERDDLLDAKDLVLSGQAGDGDWRTMRVQHEPRQLVVGTVEPGASTVLTIRVALAPGAGLEVGADDLLIDVGLAETPLAGSWITQLLPSSSAISSILVPLGILVVAGGALVVNRLQVKPDEPSFSPPRRRAVTAVTVEGMDRSHHVTMR